MDKTLQITFYQSEANGIKILEFTKGEIIGFFIPKIMFNSDLLQIPYFKNRITNCGIYFLSGDELYIGQALNLFERFKGHIRDGKKEFKDILFFTTTNNSFDEGDVNYLEKSIILLAKETGNINLMNLNNGNNTNIKEYRKSDLNNYILEIKFLLNILGYKFLENIKENNGHAENVYYIEKDNIKAKMLLNENGYVVFAGSYGKNNETNSMLDGYKRLKIELLDKGIIELNGSQLLFKKDYVFSSSTAPAQILLGYSISGPKLWKNKYGKSLEDFEKLSII